MGGIELPQLGEGLFQSSPQPSERNGLLLGDLIVENVDGSAMRAKIAGHRFIITSGACATMRPTVASSGFVGRLSIGLQVCCSLTMRNLGIADIGRKS